MAAHVTTFDSPIVNGAQPYVLPFRPRIIYFLVANHGNANALVDDHHKAIGVAAVDLDGTIRQNGGGFEVVNGSTPGQCAGAMYTNACIAVPAPSGGTIIRAQLTAVSDTGFTLNWIDTYVNPIRVSILAIGGDFRTYAGFGGSRTSLGTSDYTVAGFEPDGLMVHAMLQNNALPVAASGFASSGMIGFANAGNQISHAWRANNNSDPHRSAVQQEEGKVLAALSVLGTAKFREASFDSFLSNGMRLNWTTVNPTVALFLYLLTRGLPMHIGRFTVQAATGIQTVSGLTVEPEALLLFSHNQVPTVGRLAHNRTSWGATDGTRQFSIWGGDRDLNGSAAGTTTIAVTQQDDTKLLELASEGAGVTRTLVADCTFNSFGADSFSVNWANTGGGGQDVGFVAFGAAASSPVGVPGISGPLMQGWPPSWGGWL